MKYTVPKVSHSVLALAALVAVGTGFGIGAIASADSTTATASTSQVSTFDHHGPPGVHGTVSAINGTTITLTSTNPSDQTTTTYTVDATNANIMKAPANTTTPTAPTTISLSDILIGDTLNIRGTVSGTTVTATDIMDGLLKMRGGFGKDHGVGGTITAINGSTIIISDASGKTYTVTADAAKIDKVTTISASDLAVGDSIHAEGTITGTTVAATHIMDGMPMGGPKPQDN